MLNKKAFGTAKETEKKMYQKTGRNTCKYTSDKGIASIFIMSSQTEWRAWKMWQRLRVLYVEASGLEFESHYSPKVRHCLIYALNSSTETETGLMGIMCFNSLGKILVPCSSRDPDLEEKGREL